MLSHVRLFATPWTVASQAPLSVEFSRQEYWSVLPFPSPGDFLGPGIELVSLVSPALTGGFLLLVPPGKPIGKVEQIIPCRKRLEEVSLKHLAHRKYSMVVLITSRWSWILWRYPSGGGEGLAS